MATATYVIEVDTKRDATYGGTYDDITDLVLSMSWNVGMQDSFDRLAPPAHLNLTLENLNGEFRQRNYGAELITNGDFSAWVADNPTGWTVTGESGSNPYVNEVGGGQLQGGAGTGMANLYSTTAALSMSQTILTPGERYYVTFDIDGIGGIGGVVCKSGSTAVSPVYHLGGHKAFSFYATDTSFVIAADNGNGTVDVTIDNVSVKRSDRYDRALRKGTLIRVRTTIPVAATLFVGKIRQIQPSAGSFNTRMLKLVADDAIEHLGAVEFAPSLMTNVTANTAIAEIFDNAVIPWPYANVYWMLGIEGNSELGTTTKLYQHVATSFDTGSTTFEYTGDNLDRGNSIAALGFIRDLLDAELGRFFFNSRTNAYIFHRRHRDVLNTTVSATFTQDDLEAENTVLSSGDDVVNHAIVHYRPRKVGAAGTVIWDATNVPISLRSREQRTFNARYRDAGNPSARVGAQNVISPLQGTDYIANTESNGTGSTLSHVIKIAIEKGAASSKITVISNYSRTSYITTLQLRGTPITVFDKRFVESRNGDSARDHEYAQMTYDLPAVGNEDYAKDFADWTVTRFAIPIDSFKRVGFDANGTDTRMTQTLNRTIGDRITITDNWTGHAQDYFIVGEAHDVKPGGEKTHRTSWILKLAERETFWVLGTVGFSELGQKTRLAF